MTVYDPRTELAVTVALATPSASVVAVIVAGLVLAPNTGPAKVTTTPDTGLFEPSTTVTCSGRAKAVPIWALWLPPPAKVSV